MLLLMDAIDANKARTNSGSTPLFIASLYGHVEVVKDLLSAPTIIVSKGTADNQTTPLQVARQCGREAVVELLVASGAVSSKLEP